MYGHLTCAFSIWVVSMPIWFTFDKSNVDIQIKYGYYNISRPPILNNIYLLYFYFLDI